jgi:hypothetical protein
MSGTDHEELSPLHRLMTRIRGRLEMNERHADRHPDFNMRSDAAIRVECYRLVVSELNDTLAEVAKDQVDRIIAARKRVDAVFDRERKGHG